MLHLSRIEFLSASSNLCVGTSASFCLFPLSNPQIHRHCASAEAAHVASEGALHPGPDLGTQLCPLGALPALLQHHDQAVSGQLPQNLNPRGFHRGRIVTERIPLLRVLLCRKGKRKGKFQAPLLFHLNETKIINKFVSQSLRVARIPVGYVHPAAPVSI